MLKDISQVILVLIEWYMLIGHTSWQTSIIGAEKDRLLNKNELGADHKCCVGRTMNLRRACSGLGMKPGKASIALAVLYP